MRTLYVGDVADAAALLDLDALGSLLAPAGVRVSAEKTPDRPQAGDLSLVPAAAGITSSLRHELNNPLTAVLGFLQLLLRRPDHPPDVDEKIRKVFEHASRVKEMIRRPGPPLDGGFRPDGSAPRSDARP